MFCQKCGNKLNEDAKFCGRCGAPIDRNKDKEKENFEETRKIPKQDIEEKDTFQDDERNKWRKEEFSTESTEQRSYNQTDKKGKNKGSITKIGIGFAVGLVVLALGIGFFNLIGKPVLTGSDSSSENRSGIILEEKGKNLGDKKSLEAAMDQVLEDLEISPKSKETLLMRLTSVHDFTEEEAEAALDEMDIDFKEQAALSAFKYVQAGTERTGVEQLKSYLMDELLFKEKEANYAIIEVQEEREKENQKKLQEAASKVEEKKKSITKTQTAPGDMLTYFVENCNSIYFTREDISSFTASEARIARNAIYAHYGWSFQDSSLRNYFDNYSWYSPSVSSKNFKESWLNSYGRANKGLIIKFEKERGYNQ